MSKMSLMYTEDSRDKCVRIYDGKQCTLVYEANYVESSYKLRIHVGAGDRQVVVEECISSREFEQATHSPSEALRKATEILTQRERLEL